jgi:hypothetical protein
MKYLIISLAVLAVSNYVIAGGDYGGGPKVIALDKQDTHVNLNDLKLSRDKNFVELSVAYRMVRNRTNPLLTEEEEKKLRRGKFTSIKFSYDKELFHQDILEKLDKRKKLTLFKSKYKKMARDLFELEEIKRFEKRRNEQRFYEVRLK